MNNEEHLNWVKARADCTLEGTFEDLIEVVIQDVKCFNNLSPDKRRHLQFKHERVNRTVFIGNDSEDGMQQQPKVEICIKGTRIQVLHGHEVLFDIEREWNPETLKCDLLISRKVRSLWQISQQAIGDLLFP